MDKLSLIKCFHDTLNWCDSPKLKNSTKKAKKRTTVYDENIWTDQCASLFIDEAEVIEVIEGTSFAIAKKYLHYGKVGVLNFANPHYPGGGVENGAMAQEECLCRSSNLYPCLRTDIAKTEYYDYNKSKNGYFFSDRIIYSEGITVFKNDDLIPVIMPENEWFNVSVITCAAPYIAERKHTNKAALKALFKKRINNIFKVALKNKIEVLILGAFGCGAFKNPPEIVASAFHEVIREENYIGYFKKIIFAIKSTANSNASPVCSNITAFQLEFCKKSQNNAHMNFQIFSDNVNRKSAKMPSGIVLEGKEAEQYFVWREENQYKNKQFSILGDSISTLEGYNPQGYKVFYTGENCTRSNVRTMEDTWWGEVIEFFGGELLVNNSWSGSRVTSLLNCSQLFPSGCSDERTSSLHINTTMPDVIIIYLGTNDWAFGANIIGETCVLPYQEFCSFEFAYNSMFKKIRKNYPNSEIWCCTLSESYISNCADFKFPYEYSGIHIDEYNDVIRNVCQKNKGKLIDLYRSKAVYDSIDGSHPTKMGMDTIAAAVLRSIIGTKADLFINNQEKHTFSDEMEMDNSQYEESTVNIQSKLYLDILRITIKRTGQQIIFCKKKEIYVDKDLSGNLIFESDCKMIKHCQAVFLYEQSMWFLMDNYFIDGIWLNGIRMQTGKKYQLITNDVIDFAHSETVIFDNDKALQVTNEIKNTDFENTDSVALSEMDRIKSAKLGQQDEKIVLSQSVPQKQDELIGAVIENKYYILQLLNSDIFFNVYLVKNIRNDTIWSMKSYNKANKNDTSILLEEIMWEAHITKNLKHFAIPYPYILDIIEDDRYIFVVQEYIEGVNLELVVQNSGAQSAEKVIDLGKKLCDFLGYMHHFAPPLIYRDMKPANVILKPDGQIKVISFATVLEYDRMKAGSNVLGTVGYAPPEQYNGYEDVRTDIYALGKTMYRLVTGIDPMKNPHEIQPICLIHSNLPKGLEYIILKCTQINPKDRYQSCYELMYDLNNYEKLFKRE